MLKLLIASVFVSAPLFADGQDARDAASLKAPIADQSASSRYEKKDPQEFAREQIAKDRKDINARGANEQSTPKGSESNSTGASEGAEGHSSDSGTASGGAEKH